ncbi:YihY family inner membrane protein [Variovorax guangxiensis]|uniref:YihY family inner membrane protein n=1 Tax=Variovorax guangxiensis TaxID=1775474 RepID=A0A3S0ZBL0_9BURK|nr:YihY family inner membrane protein [Variovorax guangxiensis]
MRSARDCRRTDDRLQRRRSLRPRNRSTPPASATHVCPDPPDHRSRQKRTLAPGRRKPGVHRRIPGRFHGAHRTLPPSLAVVLDLGPLVLGVAALTSMFYLVPNTKVRLRDAFAGGLIASMAFELGKRGFTTYLVKMPTYKALYGAFAVLPMFLLWVYFSWLVTLVAAMMTANLALTRRRPAGKPARA